MALKIGAIKRDNNYVLRVSSRIIS